MKTLKVLTIVAITGLAGTVAANACPSNGQNKKMCEKQEKCEKQNKCQKNKHYNKGAMKKIYKELDLTPEQQSAMKANREGMREQRQAKRVQMHSERGMAGMSKFVSANGFDKQGFIEMAMIRNQNRIEMRANMFENKINILTAEQRVKLVTLLQEKSK